MAPLAALYGDKEAQDETFIHFLRDHHRAPVTLDEGKSIYSHKLVDRLKHFVSMAARQFGVYVLNTFYDSIDMTRTEN